MFNKKLLRNIRGWQKDFEDQQPHNVILDPEDQTFEGSAYYLFCSVLNEGKRVNKKGGE